MGWRERWRGSGAAKFVRRAGAGRVAISAALLILALLFARYSWSINLSRDAELALYDTRLLLASPRVDEDKRIVLVVYDEETLAQTGKRSPLDRVILSKALRNLDKMGARGIGIDILIDQAQAEDPELIAVMRSMKTPVKLAFSSNAETGAYIQPWQEAFMREFQAKVAAGNVRPGDDPDRGRPRRGDAQLAQAAAQSAAAVGERAGVRSRRNSSITIAACSTACPGRRTARYSASSRSSCSPTRRWPRRSAARSRDVTS